MATSGRTQVHGRVIARATLTAPLSGRRCVAYQLWGEVGGEVIDRREAVPFALSLPGGVRGRIDGRAELRVDFHHGDGQLRYRRKWLDPRVPGFFSRTFGLGRPSQALEAFLAELGITEPARGVLHQLALEPGAGALVEGRLEEPRPGGYRDALPVHTISETEDGAPVVIRSRDAPPGT